MAEVLEKPKEAFFGKAEKKLVTDPFLDNNPITIQVLGICSALAVTTQLWPSIVMTISVLFVIIFANVITSLVRKMIPSQVRMIVQLVIIATLVTIVELTLKAVSFDVYKQLAVFIGLIITNCIVMGRLEAFALANGPKRAFWDGVGNGLGYGFILLVIAFFRELFGKGTLLAGSPFGTIRLVGNTDEFLINTADSAMFGWYANNGLMVLSPSAMFLIGIFIWIHRSRNRSLIDIS